MAKIQIKRTTSSNAPSALDFGELAYSNATNRLYIGKNDGSVRPFAITDFGKAETDINMDNNVITNVGTPSNSGDAINKSYLEQQIANIALGNTWRDPVRLASISNIAISNQLTSLDSTTLNNNDRVLLKDQTNAGENGIYVYNSGTQLLSRATEVDTLLEINKSTVLVTSGTNFNSQYQMSVNDVNGNLNTEFIIVTKIGGNGYTVGNGLLNINTALTVDVNTDSIVIVNNKLQIKGHNIQGVPLVSPTVDGDPAIYQALNLANSNAVQNTLPINRGGTGGNTASNARTALGLGINVDVQGYSTRLAQIAGLNAVVGNILIHDGNSWILATVLDGGTY